MKNEIKLFENEEFGQVRTILIDGEPWFVGKDVAEVLGYSNASKALFDHVGEEDKLNNESLSSLGQRGGWLINESGLYSLVMGSQLPTAKKFKHWVTSEVLPTLGKTGTYTNNTTYQYPLPAATFEAVANLGRLIERTMKAEGACPHEIAIVLKSVFCQSGIEMQDCFIKIPAYEQFSIINHNGKLTVV